MRKISTNLYRGTRDLIRLIFLGLFFRDLAILWELFRRDLRDNVLVVKYRGHTILDLAIGRNIVTDNGDQYYAEMACAQSPTKAYTTMYLASAGPGTPGKTDVRSAFTDISGSNKAKTSGYPKTADADGDNTGAGVDVISWLFAYTTGDGNWTGITHCYITIASPGAAETLLCSIKFSAGWAKDANTSAKVFVNHTQNGI
jgi:hypothetical protein